MSGDMREVVFQAKADLLFVRFQGGQYHGTVAVRKVHADKSIQLLAEFTPAEWASIVATMTCLGETGATFTMFEALQKG